MDDIQEIYDERLAELEAGYQTEMGSIEAEIREIGAQAARKDDANHLAQVRTRLHLPNN